jgi:phosphatidylserine decarboxylase
VFLLRELRWVVALLAILAAVAQFALAVDWAWFAWAAVLLAAFVVRERPRRLCADPLAVVSPVDGRVIDVRRMQDPWLDREAIRLRIRQHPWGELGLRAPTEGKVVRGWRPGEIEQSADDAPPQAAIWLQTDEGDDVLLALDTARRLSLQRCDVHAGERAGQGRRCGLVGPAQRLDLYVPGNSGIDVQAGGPVKAGVTIVATLVHDSDNPEA